MILFGAKFSGHAIALVGIFTVIEVVTLTLWLQTFLHGQQVLSAAVLAAGLLVEHTISAATGVFVQKAP